jgi:hypothetical protein
VNDIPWLPGGGGRIDHQQQQLRQVQALILNHSSGVHNSLVLMQRWSWSVFGWILRHLVFPLIRAHFFVTETKESGSRMCVICCVYID